MPIYEYRCEACEVLYEILQKMSDDPLTECEECGGPLRRVLHPVAIHFKGSGFYTTDYGKGSGRPTGKDTESGDGSSGAAESVSSDGAGSKRATTSTGESKPKEKPKAT